MASGPELYTEVLIRRVERDSPDSVAGFYLISSFVAVPGLRGCVWPFLHLCLSVCAEAQIFVSQLYINAILLSKNFFFCDLLFSFNTMSRCSFHRQIVQVYDHALKKLVFIEVEFTKQNNSFKNKLLSSTWYIISVV